MQLHLKLKEPTFKNLKPKSKPKPKPKSKPKPKPKLKKCLWKQLLNIEITES